MKCRRRPAVTDAFFFPTDASIRDRDAWPKWLENGRGMVFINPPHLGELIREGMDEVGWNVTQTAARLGCERGTLSRLLNGKAGVSANMALALEAIGWGTADHWMRMQASYELAEARRARGWQEDIRVRDAVPR